MKLFLELLKDKQDKYWVTEKCWYDYEKPMNGSDAGYGVFDTFDLAIKCINDTKVKTNKEVVIIYK